MTIDWKKLSWNPNLTWDIVNKNRDKPWDWPYLTRHPCIPAEVIENNPHLPWHYESLSDMKKITSWEFIRLYIDKPWNFYHLSKDDVPVDIIVNYAHKGWSWSTLCKRQDVVEALILTENRKYIDWFAVFRHHPKDVLCHILQDDVLNLFTESDKQALYLNARSSVALDSIPLKLIMRIGDSYDWWSELSYRKDLTQDIILMFKSYRWDWTALSRSPVVDWEFVKANPSLPWDFAALSMNPNIDIDIIRGNPFIPWSLSNFQCNPNFFSRNNAEMLAILGLSGDEIYGPF